MRLVFDAPEGHLLIVDGEEFVAGKPFDIEDEERALELLTDPNISVREARPSNLASLKRPELDQLAVEAGIDPADFNTKQDVIDALETIEPEAAGVGHEPDQEE